MQQKTKEISIRRVTGSNVSGIIILFSKDFIILTSVAFLFAVPICYLWFSEWLRSFEVQIEISVWNFIGPFILTLLITLLTTGFIVSKTASLSPAENLRSE